MNLPQTQRLLAIMAQLRDPETGCAWDLQQDFSSLLPYLLEEAYEVADAIERNHLQDLHEELGDLLLQVVFHSRIAEEQGVFDFEAVAAGISDKLIRRHPHVFAGVRYADAQEQKAAWETIKATERAAKSRNIPQTPSVLADIATNLPALLFCEKIQSRAAEHGFDWPDIEPVFDKVQEEIAEVKEAIAEGDQAHVAEEIGDLLFVVVNLARHLKVNPEVALRASTQKFTNRFQYIEQSVNASKRALTDCALLELDLLWHEAKQALKKSN